MAKNKYVVLDEESGHIVKSGFFGRQVFTNKNDAKDAASGNDDRKVYKLTRHGV